MSYERQRAYQKAHPEKHREYQRAYYQRTKAEHYVRSRARYLKLRDHIRQVKEQTPCADCKVQYPPCVMDFDHLRDKSFNVSNVRGWASLETLKAEIAKCELVCANCHRLRTHARKSATAMPQADCSDTSLSAKLLESQADDGERGGDRTRDPLIKS